MTPDNPLYVRLQELEKETDFEFIVELIDLYLNETPRQVKFMLETLKQQEFLALTIIAHTLKGSSLNLGAKKLGALCSKLEDLGRASQPVPENMYVAEIEEELARVMALLKEYKQKKSDGQ
jgi:HPt (histidine-containing phosphotransfer) domain-containing protein